MNQAKKYIIIPALIFTGLKGMAQEADTLNNDRFSIHAQTTVITQYKPAFRAKYTGQNSLVPREEAQRSITATFFLGAKLWKGASIFMNPEIGGGSGLSSSLGVGASTNGETYRVSTPSPAFELARLFFRQIISLNKETAFNESDLNRLGGRMPTEFFSIILGKICMSDFFDNNKYSHEPRTQFMSWALMTNGAWDYPANTRGYTPSVIFELITPRHELRYGFSLVSTTPNGMIMNWAINKAGSHTLEYTHNYTFSGRKGAFRFLTFFTTANMGNYNQSVAISPESPDIKTTEKYGHTKYGFGLSCDQEITKDLGAFLRASWNDGKNETWEFTEIDRSVSCGLSLNGKSWSRKNDNIGLAYVVSGLSAPHRNYLKAGGLGFELGDGNLNYAPENLLEFYYSMELIKNINVSGAYQFIGNPGYNKDRGPVNIFSIRVHIEI